MTPEQWYVSAFDEDYLSRYSHRDNAEARAAVGLLMEHAPEMGAESRVFDLCCGAGRHLAALAERGLRPAGGDLSEALLRQAAAFRRPLMRMDMRNLPLRDGSLDLLTNFFTAFGYFPRDEENFQVLAEVARVLRPGGLFLFDFLNAARVREEMADCPCEEEVKDAGGRRWQVVRQLAEGGRRVEKVQREATSGRVIHESVRLFTAAELHSVLTGACELEILHAWGDYEGHPFDERRSPRYIGLYRKSGRVGAV
jgi:SAM-dependent methyltransferase